MVFNPEILKRCSWPTGRRELLRAAAAHTGADPFELFPNEYAQIANAGQGSRLVLNAEGHHMESGNAPYDPISTYTNTAADYATQYETPAWQRVNGVKWNRYRTCNTPYRSVRWRPVQADEEMVAKLKRKSRTLKVSRRVGVRLRVRMRVK